MYSATATSFHAALRKDERGSVAMIFAISLFVLIMSLGLAVDIGRAFHTKMRVASALDAAALAAAKSMHDREMNTADLSALARSFFEANLRNGKPNFGSITGFDVVVDKVASSVRVSAVADVPTVFARIGGIDTVSFPTVAAAAYNPKDIEVAVALDVTGSMCNPCRKIADLQDAAGDMVDILLPANKSSTNQVRIALAPFAAGVNAGGYFTAATNRRGGDGCTFERDGADRTTDAAPGAAYLKVAGDPGVSSSRSNCPSGAEVTALTDNRRDLKAAIGDLRSGGSTAGHLGTAWAWYLVSPNWKSIWPSAPAEYGDKKTIKAVVLMTDGVYNTFGGTCDRSCSNTSAQARDSQATAKQLCQGMRDKGVQVYSVGFMLDDPIAEAVLKECASSANNFFRAEDGDSLRTAFRRIAEDLMRLRLSQ